MKQLPKDHLYKISKFSPNWGMETSLGNWKINEIVNSSHRVEDAMSKCHELAESDEMFDEATDSIVRDKLTEYFNPEILTHGERELKDKGMSELEIITKRGLIAY